MKIIKAVTQALHHWAIGLLCLLLAHSTFAADVLARSLEGDVQDSLGSRGAIWKIFIFADIVIATAAAIKSRSPMVFFGVLIIVFVPTYLVHIFVFR